eukprot:TRINITY_DN47459_c0_g1_i1.p1 TRINITY_DN47459_c0_g1~~TRINITY_DN47459_c0_g1_i1.p1  ORF type:complete len:173 (-),score=50.46 TRINITY_DN47459_c0_g1_i1:233-751(-)
MGAQCCSNNNDGQNEVPEGGRNDALAELPVVEAASVLPPAGKPAKAEPLPTPEVKSANSKPVAASEPERPQAKLEEKAAAPASSPEQPTFFMIKLEKKERLGVDVNHQPNTNVLVVEEITEGAVKDWNDKNPDKKVIVGDQIVEVNGASGDVGKMVDECKTSSSLEIKIKRG